jgi:hypothetical protein
MYGSSLVACGIGTSQLESEARELAYANAIQEFKTTCELSNTCRGYSVAVEPKRTECELRGGVYTCWRAIRFEWISRELSSESSFRWKGGFGISTGVIENDKLHVGYGLDLRFKLAYWLQPFAAVGLGKITYGRDSDSFASAAFGNRAYFVDRWFWRSAVEFEKSWGQVSGAETRAVGGFGVDAVKVERATVGVECAAKWNGTRLTGPFLSFTGAIEF